MEKKSAATQILETIKEIPGTMGILRTLREMWALRKSVWAVTRMELHGEEPWSGGPAPAGPHTSFFCLFTSGRHSTRVTGLDWTETLGLKDRVARRLPG